MRIVDWNVLGTLDGLPDQLVAYHCRHQGTLCLIDSLVLQKNTSPPILGLLASRGRLHIENITADDMLNQTESVYVVKGSWSFTPKSSTSTGRGT